MLGTFFAMPPDHMPVDTQDADTVFDACEAFESDEAIPKLDTAKGHGFLNTVLLERGGALDTVMMPPELVAEGDWGVILMHKAEGVAAITEAVSGITRDDLEAMHKSYEIEMAGKRAARKSVAPKKPGLLARLFGAKPPAEPLTKRPHLSPFEPWLWDMFQQVTAFYQNAQANHHAVLVRIIL